MKEDEMDFEARYRAMETRDESLAGEFFAAVTTTGIYCRPGCPARTPKRENVRFYRTGAAARSDGFRACLRCHPGRL
jgi:methylphosphotriester-DNA--protein-cysteine methyltransferase